MPTTPKVYDVVEARGMQGMYANCKSLKNVVVPDILQPIGGAEMASMFAGCSNLESGEVLTTHFYEATCDLIQIKSPSGTRTTSSPETTTDTGANP